MALHSAYPLYWNNYKIQTVKLSKAQQEVVDKMREGWELVVNHRWEEYYLAQWDQELKKDVSLKAIQHLLANDMIYHHNTEGHLFVYQLTEKYRKDEH